MSGGDIECNVFASVASSDDIARNNANYECSRIAGAKSANQNNSSGNILPVPETTSELNISVRLQTSICSSLSSESDLSLALDRDLESEVSNDEKCDELPVFDIRNISPLSRSPSPIDHDLDAFDLHTPQRLQSALQNLCLDNPNFVALQDIDAQISPPSDTSTCGFANDDTTLSRTSSLETIFEGVFLNTPPRAKLSSSNACASPSLARQTTNRTQLRSRSNLLEKVAMNRLQSGKENQSPANYQLTNAVQSKQLPQEQRKDSSSLLSLLVLNGAANTSDVAEQS